MSRRNDLGVRLALLAATLAIAVFILIRARKLRDAALPPQPPPPATAPAPAVAQPDLVRDAYRALLVKVTALMDEERYPEACDMLDAFAKEHPGTRWAQIATLNRTRVEAMRAEVEERDRQETLERIEADLALLLAAEEFEEALKLLDEVPAAERDEAWQEQLARVTELREEALHAVEPEPAEHPERGSLAKMAEEAESLGRQGDLPAARRAAEALSARLRQLDVPCLDEEFGPRASAVLELASLAEIEAVLPGDAPSGDLSKLTPRDRIDLIARLCAAWDFGILPDWETIEEIRRDHWREAVEACRLLTSPTYHLLRHWHGLPRLPFLGSIPAYIRDDPSLESV